MLNKDYVLLVNQSAFFFFTIIYYSNVVIPATDLYKNYMVGKKLFFECYVIAAMREFLDM